MVPEEGNIVLVVKHIGSIRDGGEVQPMLVPVEADRIRLRIFNEYQNIVKDVEIPTNGEPVPIEVRVPIGTYDIQAIAYQQQRTSRDSFN